MENGSANGGAAAKRRRRRGQSSLGMRAAGSTLVAGPPQLEALPAPHLAGPPRGLAPVAGRFMSSTTAEHLTSTRFADLEGISPLTKRCGAQGRSRGYWSTMSCAT